jgi:hypothetical protein
MELGYAADNSMSSLMPSEERFRLDYLFVAALPFYRSRYFIE